MQIALNINSKNYQLLCRHVLKYSFALTEAYAAKEAGVQVAITIRPGNAPLTDQETKDFRTVRDFNNS